MIDLRNLLDIRKDVGDKVYREFEDTAHHRLITSNYFQRGTEARQAFIYGIIVHLYSEYKEIERAASMAGREGLDE